MSVITRQVKIFVIYADAVLILKLDGEVRNAQMLDGQPLKNSKMAITRKQLITSYGFRTVKENKRLLTV